MFTAMAAATFAITAISILASFIIDDLSITREQLGYAATMNILIGAALSPMTGRVIDRIGGRRGFVGIFLMGGAAFVIMGGAVAYWILLAGAAVSAFALAAGNPATNKLIVLHLPAGTRGVVTGVKQSGVQGAAFAGGILLPLGAETIGWRPTLVIAGLTTLAVILAVVRVIPEDRLESGEAAGSEMPLPPATNWLTVYGGLLGFGGSATFFVPLFAEEAVGYGPRSAGLAAALIGLIALAGRIAWARFAEQGTRFVLALGAIASIAIVASFVFLAATTAEAFLWIGVVVAGVSSSSWNSVGMLAIMHESGAALAGRASGRVMLGFLVGLGVAPPIYGRTIDATGSYTSMWWLSIGAFTAAVGLAFIWARSVAAVEAGGVATRAGEEGVS